MVRAQQLRSIAENIARALMDGVVDGSPFKLIDEDYDDHHF